MLIAWVAFAVLVVAVISQERHVQKISLTLTSENFSISATIQLHG